MPRLKEVEGYLEKWSTERFENHADNAGDHGNRSFDSWLISFEYFIFSRMILSGMHRSPIDSTSFQSFQASKWFQIPQCSILVNRK